MAIQSINAGDINRITSGQVITDVRAVIKELVENALDAGATSVEVVIEDYGMEKITVTDNGHGINVDDFAHLCRRGFTSKIVLFADLMALSSLGFRGEALHSLCTVVKQVKVTTVVDNSQHLLTYDKNGAITDHVTKSTRQPSGTTVQIIGLFHNLPVRLKHLKKLAGGEYRKAITLLNKYVIINPNIKFNVAHINQGKKQAVLLARGGPTQTILTALLAIFGKNGAKGLSEVEIELSDGIRICGYISNFSFGYGGRLASDRQFFYINHRPVVHKKLIKVINEVYHQFNNAQHPVVVLDLIIPPLLVDVNLAPDKTKVMIIREPQLLEEIREGMKDFFDGQGGITIPRSEFANISMSLETKPTSAKNVERKGKLEKEMDSHGQKKATSEPVKLCVEEVVLPAEIEITKLGKESSIFVDENGDDDDQEVNTATCLLENLDLETHTREGTCECDEGSDNVADLVHSDPQNQEDRNNHSRSNDIEDPDHVSSRIAEMEEAPLFSPNTLDVDPAVSLENEHSNIEDHLCESHDEEMEKGELQEEESFLLQAKGKKTRETSIPSRDSQKEVMEYIESEARVLKGYSSEETGNEETYDHSQPSTQLSQFRDTTEPTQDNYGVNFYPATPQDIEVSIGSHTRWDAAPKRGRAQLLHDVKRKVSTEEWTFSPQPWHRSHSETDTKKPAADNVADQDSEMLAQYIVSKSDFLKMKLIGQFNLGFILVRSPDDNLFIIDQHASDEKFNFELLVSQYRAPGQTLVQPLTVQLTVIDELLVEEKLDLFKKNGFTVDFDASRAPGERVRLKLMPLLKLSTQSYTVDDFYELLSLIADNPHTKSVRPLKVRRQLAMKACRLSIMIGASLTPAKMEEVVKNLASLDKPWNCPHGRPTMRHLLEITRWKSDNFPDYSL